MPCCCITEEQFWRCTSMVSQIWAHLQQIVFYFIPLQNISERFLQAADSFEMTELQQLWDGRLWVGGEVNHSQLLRFSCKTNQAITEVIIVFQSFFSRTCLTWAGSSSLNVKTCCFYPVIYESSLSPVGFLTVGRTKEAIWKRSEHFSVNEMGK